MVQAKCLVKSDGWLFTFEHALGTHRSRPWTFSRAAAMKTAAQDDFCCFSRLVRAAYGDGWSIIRRRRHRKSTLSEAGARFWLSWQRSPRAFPHSLWDANTSSRCGSHQVGSCGWSADPWDTPGTGRRSWKTQRRKKLGVESSKAAVETRLHLKNDIFNVSAEIPSSTMRYGMRQVQHSFELE